MLAPVRVINKAILVCPLESRPDAYVVVTYVNGRVHSSYNSRPLAEAEKLAEALAANDPTPEQAALLKRAVANCRRRQKNF